ncbi:MAG TPA: hypothetical protein VHF25_11360 [Nitriliruptorales bacterium]|nr:hypothetical protein [Nitriliruptorales bacterium]
MTRWRGPVLGLLASLSALLLVAGVVGVAAAQQGPPQYPPGAVAVACAQTAARPGDPPFCRVGGFAPSSQVTVELRGPVGGQSAGAPLAMLAAPLLAQAAPQTVYRNVVTADADGFAADDINVPPGTTPGDYELTFSGVDPAGAPRVATTQVEVLPAVAQQGGRGLSSTGAMVTNALLVGAAAVVVGGGLLVATRRRGRRRESEPVG